MKEPVLQDDSGPAFPIPGAVRHYDEGSFDDQAYAGMSIRQWYAGKALQGLMMDERMLSPPDGVTIADHLADNSFAVADAMIKRSKAP